ncbi:MAG: hypothetical protein JOZ38_08405 [Candidatus Eremiobacteraeota bacterium]|nr:hypothetical protein [Candidatus Eremiobacteraeota bacterium]
MKPTKERRPTPEELLRDLGGRARLVVYLSSAPGAGKTRRLLEEARRLRVAGINVKLGAIEFKDRPDLQELAAGVPALEPRMAAVGTRTFPEFDYERAIEERPTAIVLDELAHDNLPGSVHAKRWQDALALRDKGITVLGAFNIAHLETVAATAESLTGYPVREIIPLSFLKSADEVIALDASPQLLQQRVRSGKIVRPEDAERALAGVFSEATLEMLRQLMLRTIDDLTMPSVSAEQVSTATAFTYADLDPQPYLRRVASIAAALDLKLEIAPCSGCDLALLERIARDLDAEVLAQPADPARGELGELRSSLIAVPAGPVAARLANRHIGRDLFVVGRGQTYIGETPLVTNPYGATAGDRMRVGYGRLTVYLGASAGCGKTYAMLDRAQQMKAEGIDVVAAYIEPHDRPETTAMIDGLEQLPRQEIVHDGIAYRELDRDAVLRRHPRVALIDELAHTNAPGSLATKRYEDVLAIVRSGIDVITTLNVQHLEALSDAVFRLTGTVVRETLPDGILAFADEVILIDVSPETLRERLRAGKIYPAERIESALANFFRTDNLLALRELAVREVLHARNRQRIPAPFERLLLSVAARKDDVALVKRSSRIAARLEVEFAVAHITDGKHENPDLERELEAAAIAENAHWIREHDVDVVKGLLRIARQVPETTVVVSGTRRTPQFFSRKAFARQMLDAGARELLVLAPRAASGEMQAID